MTDYTSDHGNDDHSFWDELAAGSALHGLSPEEETLFVDHLETCDLCTASLKDHVMVAAQLGSIAHYREHDEDEAPSWDLMRASILDSEPASGNPSTDTVVIDFAARRRRYTASKRVLSAAAVVAVLAGGGVAAWRLTSGTGSSPGCGGTCHTVKLDAAGGKMEASVVVRDAAVTVTPSGMGPAPKGKVYVLWQLERHGRATAIVSFKAGSTSATATAGLPAAYSDTSGFAISEETASAAPFDTPSNTLASGSAT